MKLFLIIFSKKNQRNKNLFDLILFIFLLLDFHSICSKITVFFSLVLGIIETYLIFKKQNTFEQQNYNIKI